MSLGKLIALSSLLQLTLPVSALAQRSGIEQLFPAEPTGYVTDMAGVLDPASIRDIERRSAALKSATGAEIAVVTLPTIRDYAPVDVAARGICSSPRAAGSKESSPPPPLAGSAIG